MAKSKSTTASTTKKTPAAKAKPAAAKTTAAKSTSKPKAVAKGKGKTKAEPVKPLTKTQLVATMAERTELTKVQVGNFFDKMFDLIKEQIATSGAGSITLPIGIKLEMKEKPAQDAREVTNPRTGEKVMRPPQPAKMVVKARVMKQLKDVAE